MELIVIKEMAFSVKLFSMLFSQDLYYKLFPPFECLQAEDHACSAYPRNQIKWSFNHI